jgi:hypothetical protein
MKAADFGLYIMGDTRVFRGTAGKAERSCQKPACFGLLIPRDFDRSDLCLAGKRA